MALWNDWAVARAYHVLHVTHKILASFSCKGGGGGFYGINVCAVTKCPLRNPHPALVDESIYSCFDKGCPTKV